MRLLAAALLCVVGAFGTDIRMDLSTFVSSTPGNWNNISNLNCTTPNLIDFNTGTGTGVSFTGSASWLSFFGDDAGTFPNRDWLIQPAPQDGAGLAIGQTGTFAISGLASGTYEIEVVSARTAFNYLNTFTVNGATANRTELGTAVNTPWASTSDGLTPGNWLIWDNVSALDGNITITDLADPNTLGLLNAIRISGSAVPEPGTFGIVGLGIAFVGLAARRRRA